MMAFLIVLIGGCAAIAFLFVGIRGVQNDQNARFDRHVIRVVGSIRSTFAKYETAGLFVHQACRHRDISRQRFRELYENILSTGLEIQATSFNPNISHAERLAVENEARQFYQQYFPNVNYTGIQGLEPTAGSVSNLTVQPRSIQTFYFPVHYIEPVQGNEGAIDFDLYSSISRRATIQQIMENWRPAVVRFVAMQCVPSSMLSFVFVVMCRRFANVCCCCRSSGRKAGRQ
jgi:two-component system, NtrC family, sensor kinase